MNNDALIANRKRPRLPLQKNMSTRFFSFLMGHNSRGHLTITWPDGTESFIGNQGEAPEIKADLVINDRRAFWRCARRGALGFAEAYRDGLLDSSDLTAFFSWYLINERRQQSDRFILGSHFARAQAKAARFFRRNSKRGARKNIAYHYDLGNDFYRLWLDQSMTYSAAFFHDFSETLEAAQHQKYHRVLEGLPLKPGEKLLEIGCGWGGFAEVAAHYSKAQIRAITLSQAQYDYAKNRLKSFGPQIDLKVEDYRDTKGCFDAIASIEMFEAIGEAQWPQFFNQIAQLLKPGGRAAIQVITIENSRFEQYRKNTDFIQHYIFPGGQLPSPARFMEEAHKAGLKLIKDHSFGKSYAETLRRWRRAFNNAKTPLLHQGFSRSFLRLWHYYLCYCEAGFENGSIDVHIYHLEK